MDFVITLKGIQTAGSIFVTIKKLLSEENSFLQDIADVHYKSANQVFRHNPTKESEIRSGMTHLRSAYNANIKYLKNRKNSVERRDGYKETSVLATLIALAYNELGDDDPASAWKDKAFESFNEFSKSYKEIARENSTDYIQSGNIWVPGQKVFNKNRYDQEMEKLEEIENELDNKLVCI